MSYLFAFLALPGLTTWLATEGYFKPVAENELIRAIKNKVEVYNAYLPEERIYLQTDKPFYAPGDDIWLAGFIRDGQTLKPSTQSEIVYVELISPKGTVEQKINLIAKNGKVSGDFLLNKEALGGLYKLKAYTNWMKNGNETTDGDDNCFVKDIQVQEVILPHLKMKLDFEKKAFGAGDEVIAKLELNTNENKPLANHKISIVANLNGIKLLEKAEVTDEEGQHYIKFNLPAKLNSTDALLNVLIDYNGSTESISRSIPIVLNKIKLNFYPEGGDLVNQLENTVAFAAQNEFDKPADVEGEVLTLKGSCVAKFSSFHQGMGAFKYVPQPGEKYLVKITKPQGIEETYALPQPFDRGYLLHLDISKPGELATEIQTTETEELSLIAQVRGKIYYTTVVSTLNGVTKFNIPTANMPAGVCQVSLFDSKGIARAERLVFVNRDKQMNLSVETDKEKYLPREKVKMTITVKDERGLPMPANLSMAVVNDQLLSFADDKSGHLLSQLLLQQDLRQKIEEPAFYFNIKESKSLKALDYLLMTAGWRRFTWEKLLSEDRPPVLFQAQKALLSGYIIDGSLNKPKAGVKIKTPGGEEYTSNAEGRFSIPKQDLSAALTLTFTAEGYTPVYQNITDYEQNTPVYMYDAKARYLEEVSAVSNDARVFERERLQLQSMARNHVMEAEPAPMVKVKQVRPIKQSESEKKDKPLAANEKGEEVQLLKEKKQMSDVAVAAEINAGKADAFVFDHDLNQFKALKKMPPPAIEKKYYRARVFAAPDYTKQEVVETRSDFRNTIYWNPNIEIGFSGRKTIEFYTSDDITSFRTTIEGIAADGMPGRVEKTIFTQLPFALSTKIPVEVATEDVLSIPVTLKNNTSGPLGGYLTINLGSGLQTIHPFPSEITLMPGQAKTMYVDCKVLDKPGYADCSVAFKSCGLNDAFTQKIKLVSKGFPAQVSFSGEEEEKEYSFTIENMVHGSLRASFNAYPNVVNDLLKGVEGILQEPCGCFEQTSCTAYPNAMVLDYLKHTGNKDTKTLARATDLLERGYKRLTTFEASNKGYEWFGANPGHEGLTAYGLMEFMDMKRAGQKIDEQMFDRTARWLLTHRDGTGGFARETHAYHDFGRISEEVLNAYIVYALADAGFTDIQKEFELSHKKAIETKDPYLLALLANAAFSIKENNKGNDLLKLLLSAQQNDGSFNGSTHSITYSQGQSLSIETTALGIMALLKADNKNQNAINKAVKYLIGTRSGSGVFSSTQGTILALKSLTEYAKYSKKANEDGTILVYVDNKKVTEKSYKAGDKETINVEGLEEFIKGDGKHTVKIKYLGAKNPLPYSVAVNWNTFLPKSDAQCPVNLVTTTSGKTYSVAETMRFTAKISNRKNTDVPSTMVIVGIPAGFSAQAWQLKELQEKKVCDYYETKGNHIAFYYRGLAANAVHEIKLDLKAEIPGEYDAPASCAYLYYTNEYKTWCGTQKLIIKKPNT
ncbi:MAG: hypothetical protein IT236_04025 [Bacteroidia bacterium]|nr:hypothetical protein [Bacteroidia bacterium]